MSRSIILLTGSTALAQGITLAALPLLTRLYSPSDFGVMEVYAVMISILGAAATGRYEVALPLPAEDRDAVSLLLLCLLVSGALGSILLVVCWLFSESIASLFSTPALVDFWWLILLGLLLVACHQSLTFWAVRKRAYSRLAQAKICQTSSQSATQLAAGLAGIGPLGLLAGVAVGYLGSCSVLCRALYPLPAAASPSMLSIAASARRYRRFPLVSLWSVFINSLGMRGLTLMMPILFGLEQAGLFALSNRLMMIPLSLIGTAVLQVFVGEGARLSYQQPHGLSRLFWQMARRQAMVALLVTPVLAIPAPFMFRLVFGSDWTEAGVFAQLISVMCALQLISSPLTGCLDLTERQDLHMVRESARLGIMGSAVAVVYFGQLQPFAAVALFSAAGSLACVISFAISWRAVCDWERKVHATSIENTVGSP